MPVVLYTNDFGTVKFKTTILQEEPFKEISFKRKTNKRRPSTTEIAVHKAYNGPLSIGLKCSGREDVDPDLVENDPDEDP